MHFLVTGGRSDVARFTVDHLLARGHRVSWSGPSLGGLGRGRLVHLPRGQAVWRDLDLRSVDGVAHLAGPHPSLHLEAADLQRSAEFHTTFFDKLAGAGVQRLAMLSVVSNPRVENLPFVQLKAATEAMLGRVGIAGTVFRVPWLYGPNDDFLTRLWKWVRNRSTLLVPGLMEAPTQLCSEQVLAGAIVTALERAPTQLRTYEAATTTAIALHELISQLGLIVRGAAPKMRSVTTKAFHLRGPLRLVGLIPIRSPMWALLEGGLTCATTAFERDFDIAVQTPRRALIEFVRELNAGSRQSGRHVSRSR